MTKNTKIALGIVGVLGVVVAYHMYNKNKKEEKTSGFLGLTKTKSAIDPASRIVPMPASGRCTGGYKTIHLPDGDACYKKLGAFGV